MSRARVLFAAAILAILVVAAAFRLPRLAQRPMHADEANQACKSGRLYERGEYEYDATDHHGPSLYWLTLPSLAISGAKDLAGSGEFAYRIVPVLFGLGLIPLILLLVDGLGRRGRHGSGGSDGHFAGDWCSTAATTSRKRSWCSLRWPRWGAGGGTFVPAAWPGFSPPGPRSA